MSTNTNYKVSWLLASLCASMVLGLGVATTASAAPHEQSDTMVRTDDQSFVDVPLPNNIYLPLIPRNEPSQITHAELIIAEQGGVVQLENTTLVIAPGALAEDTEITLSKSKDSTTLGNDGVEYILLEPSGLTFQREVTLTIGYEDTQATDEDVLSAVLFSEETGEWEQVPIVAQDKVANTLTVAIPHFSLFSVLADKPLYLVMEIPGEYLRAGDILYRMDPEKEDCSSSMADWFPGHNALFFGGVGSSLIIESNQWGNERFQGCLYNGGVRKYSLDALIDESCGFYMGARRNVLASTEQQSSALDFAVEQLDLKHGYRVVGQGNRTGDNCFSCVGLVEAAYDYAGASLISDAMEFPAITPLQQFKKTVPVSEITAQVSQTIVIPVYGIVRHNGLFGSYYTLGGSVSATGLPSGSSFGGGVFTWMPRANQDGTTTTVTFDVSVNIDGKEYSESQWLAIHVGGGGENLSPPPGISRLATGGAHSCAVTSAAGVKCWGSNFEGQLGLGSHTITRTLTPTDVHALNGEAQAITTGSAHTCVLNNAGGVQCWGNNGYGSLGDGGGGIPCGYENRFECRFAPVDVINLPSSTISVDAGSFHTCALMSDGSTKCWGNNRSGQLGDGTNNNSPAPVDVIGLGIGVHSITAGGRHTCALTATGGVRCWGMASWGQLGDGTYGDAGSRLTPVDVIGLGTGVQAITAGNGHTCALTTSSGVQCWGSNQFGQVGIGISGGLILSPVDVIGLGTGVQAITAGNGHTCALTTAGGVLCWGRNGDGELGDGTNVERLSPVNVIGLETDVHAIAASHNFTCALMSGGGIRCWGENIIGELGNGTTVDSNKPVDVVWSVD